MNKLLKYYTLGTLGGLIYVFIELMWRGYSHWSMFLLGGVCFIALGLINEILPWQMPLTAQMLEKVKGYPNVVSVEANIDVWPPDYPDSERSIFPFRNARCVYSPGVAILHPCFIRRSTTLCRMNDEPWHEISVEFSPVYE